MHGPLFFIYNLLFTPAFGFCQLNIESLFTRLASTAGFVLTRRLPQPNFEKKYLCSFAEEAVPLPTVRLFVG